MNVEEKKGNRSESKIAWRVHQLQKLKLAYSPALNTQL